MGVGLEDRHTYFLRVRQLLHTFGGVNECWKFNLLIILYLVMPQYIVYAACSTDFKVANHLNNYLAKCTFAGTANQLLS